MAKITADTLISEVLELNPDAPRDPAFGGDALLRLCAGARGRRSPRPSPFTVRISTPFLQSSTKASTESPEEGGGSPRMCSAGIFTILSQ